MKAKKNCDDKVLECQLKAQELKKGQRRYHRKKKR